MPLFASLTLVKETALKRGCLRSASQVSITVYG